jgi:hypothetical protein
MGEVVVDRVLHVGWHEVVLEPLLIHFIILEDLTHYCDLSAPFLGSKTNFEYSLIVKLVIWTTVRGCLVFQYVVKDFLQ